MSTVKTLVLVGATVCVALWLGLDDSDDPGEPQSADGAGSEMADAASGPESATPKFTPAIPDSEAWPSENRQRRPQAPARRNDSQRAEDDRLSQMQIGNAVARATMGMHTGNPDVGFGTCRYTHNYSVSSQSKERVRASAEFICTSRDPQTGRTIKQKVWRPVTLKKYGGSWVADRTN